jgi:hypothetical protein
MRKPRPGSRWSRGRITRRAQYAAYMESVAWQEKRRGWYQHWTSTHDSAPVCVVCGCRWSLRSGQLHHVTYMRLGAEEPDDLVPLCPTHHARLHELWDSSPHWRALGRSAATYGIIAVLRRRLEAPQRPEARTTAATTCRTIHPTAPNPGFVS